MNTGHGHVIPRDDGVKSRCGGPAICKQCSVELAEFQEKRKSYAEEIEDLRVEVADLLAERDALRTQLQKAEHETVGLRAILNETEEHLCSVLGEQYPNPEGTAWKLGGACGLVEAVEQELEEARNKTLLEVATNYVAADKPVFDKWLNSQTERLITKPAEGKV